MSPDLIIPDIGEVEGEPSEMLCSVAYYQQITGDSETASAAVEDALQSAQNLIEEYLRRPLVKQERTETLYVNAEGNVYPAATPIESVSNGHTIRGGGHWLSGGSPENFLLVGSSNAQEITYVGGYTSLTIPTTICHAIVQTAYSLLHPAEGVPSGATSVSLGDASVSFGEGTGSGEIPGSVKSSIRRWIRREP